MSKELGALRGVYTNYGARPLGGSAGVQKTEGGSNEITFELYCGSGDLVCSGKPGFGRLA